MSTVKTINLTQKIKTIDIAFIAMFSAILAVYSWISIPAAVPFTLQTFGVFLAVGVLGGKRGTLTVLTYILMGMIGVPVFAGFSGGIGFLFSAIVMWLMECLLGKKKWVLILSMIFGLLVCYLFGTIWFMFVYARSTGAIGMWTALTWCVIPYIIPDGIKIGLAFVMSMRLKRISKLN